MHCGAALGADAVDGYCCPGCRAVGTLLRSASLERYYALRGSQGRRPLTIDAIARDRLWLEPIAASIRDGRDVANVRLDVSGLHCAGCVWVIEELFRREPGARAILVNPALGRCEMTVAPSFDLGGFVERVERFGYLFGPPDKAPDGVLDGLVVRTGVVVALAMNAMLFGVAQYFGLREEPLRTTVATLEVLLAGAAVAVGGPVFVRAACEGLRRGVLHLDVPIATGLVLSSVGTALAFVRTGDPSFADTLAVFVALMLVGRLLERGALVRSRHRLLASKGADGLYARARDGGTSRVVPATSIRAGTELWVARGEVVPVRSEALVDGVLSLAWSTGESRPVEAHAGQTIAAGAVNAGARLLRVRALEDFAQSELVSLIARNEEPLDLRSRGPLHRISGLWVVSVLAAATVTLGVYAALGRPLDGLAHATALLVVTCPCAIGIATPLAYELTVAGLRRAGVLVRKARMLERLPDIELVAFDKTGTLTTGRTRIDDPTPLATADDTTLALLQALVATSDHPKSAAVRDALAALGTDVAPAVLDVVEEIPGSGLRAQWQGCEVRLGRPGWAASPESDDLDARCDLLLTVDGLPRLALTTQEELRPDARSEIDALRREGLRIAILSGDRNERVCRVVEALGLGAHEVEALGELSPEDKARWLRQRERCLFVGDGINDVLAAEAAFVSATPSIERPFLPTRTDFVFTDPGIRPVRITLVASQRVRSSVRVNLVIAFVYNIFGASLAAAGALHPWVAAVLMPASSLFVIGRTIASLRTKGA